MLTLCYLRASTDERNASRARNQVEAFAAERGLVIASTYVENESGADAVSLPSRFQTPLAVRRYENGRVIGGRIDLTSIRERLEAAGVEFIAENGGGAGIARGG
jgi:hypothetical protein